MRLLIANDRVCEGGGVDTYLRGIIPVLRAHGCMVALLHTDRARDNAAPCDQVFSADPARLGPALRAIAAWQPDVCFSHNMEHLDVEEALLERFPVVKMMHGYFGTCISSQKTRMFPTPSPCTRELGPACLAQYLPRRCGQFSAPAMVAGYRWARRQRSLFSAYSAVVVASAHMREEFARHGVSRQKLHAIPLFAAAEGGALSGHSRPMACDVLFVGRMTSPKGGDLLIRAAARAGERLGRVLTLVMAGDGPARNKWEAIARAEPVHANFVGWIGAGSRAQFCVGAKVLAVPSIWPEPFGLVGLEAAAAGVPAVARDTGGVREWLRDGVNGVLVTGSPDVGQFAEALANVLRDESLRERLSRGARQVAAEMSASAHVDVLVRAVLRPAMKGQALV